ncbi:MAG: hypothetical protein ACFFD2_00995 [Promethearchaeota archaeon]
MEPSKTMDDILFSKKDSKENKSDLLNKIVNELMENCDSMEAVIIADWQGLSFASKLPKDVNEDEISATTLFTLEGAEGTRKELEKTLLGTKLTYLLMVSEKDNKPAYMFVFPIERLGYIASISHVREDNALIVQNMKIACKKAEKVLAVPEKTRKQKSMEPILTKKYKNVLQKLDALKNVKLKFLEPEKDNLLKAPNPQKVPTTASPSTTTPFPVPIIEDISVGASSTSSQIPLEFIEVESDHEPIEPEILIPKKQLPKFQIVFIDSTNIKYTVIIEADNKFDAKNKLKEIGQYHPVEIITIDRVG